MYSQPQKDKKFKQRSSAPQESTSKRTSLLTTFEKFQRMRPKKDPPTIMPLEGRSLIESTNGTERVERHERRHGNNSVNGDRGVDESVRINLQRLTSHSIPSIPKQRGNNRLKDIVLESSSIKRGSSHDSNNSAAEDRITQMQKQKQKQMRLRHEAREAERLKLMPHSFGLESISDEDKMNLEALKDYYCIYYVPAPSSSPVENESELHLPKLKTSSSCNQSMNDDNESVSTLRGRNSKHVGFRVSADNIVPPCTCNCKCRMYVAGNKMESPFDRVNYSISKTSAANDSHNFFPIATKKNSTSVNTSRDSSRSVEKSLSQKNSSEKNMPDSGRNERRRIQVNMPVIVYNNVASPEPSAADSNTGLAKAFKQKELRQRELSHLKEDIRELNKISELLTTSAS